MNVTITYDQLESSTKYYIFCINEDIENYDKSSTMHNVYTRILFYFSKLSK